MSALKPPPEAAGWDVVQTTARDKRHGNAIRAVTVKARSGGRYADSLTIAINPAGFGADAPPAWLRIGAKVWVMRGRGEFLGTLRLFPNGPTTVSRFGRNDKTLAIRIPAMAGHPEKGAPRTVVEYDFSDSWFEIALPAWHGPGTAKAEPAAPPNLALKPGVQPFTLAAGASSHPGWNSPKGAQAHRRALEGGAA
jgi:hypothetical protein